MTTTREHRGVVLAVILVGYLLIVLDVSILMTALPRLDADLGFSATGLSWAQNAYTLAFGGLLLLGARARATCWAAGACSSSGSAYSPPPRGPWASRRRRAG